MDSFAEKSCTHVFFFIICLKSKAAIFDIFFYLTYKHVPQLDQTAFFHLPQRACGNGELCGYNCGHEYRIGKHARGCDPTSTRRNRTASHESAGHQCGDRHCQWSGVHVAGCCIRNSWCHRCKVDRPSYPGRQGQSSKCKGFDVDTNVPYMSEE